MKYKPIHSFIYLAFIVISVLYGQSIQDLQKLKTEYENFQNNRQLNAQSLQNNNSRDISSDSPRKTFLNNYFEDDKTDSLKNALPYFGYDFFSRRDTSLFWESLPAPSDYLLGPGDEIIISIWGQTQLRQAYTISRDGKIYDEKVGLLDITGKSMNEAQNYLSKQFARVYSTLKGSQPSSYIDISLGKLKSINVHFVGNVRYPGVHPVHPFSTIIIGLIQAGGVDTTGSLREIVVKRKGQKNLKLDFYNYMLNGNIENNVQLRNGDVLFVPNRKSTITVDSLVFRRGKYESLPDETILHMINFAGGLMPNASSILGIERITPIHKRSINDMSKENYYVDFSKSMDVLVQNGDIIVAREIIPTINQVEIIGQLKRPGIYHFYEGMKLKDLVDLAGGLRDETFMKSIYKQSGEIIRRNPQNRYETVISVNLNEFYKDQEAQNINLQNLDRFVVRANLNFFERENIQIYGEVNIPGDYPLVSDNETLDILIKRAGGFTTRALKDGVSIYRLKKFFEKPNIKKVKKTPEIINEKINQQPNMIIEEKEESRIKVAWKNNKISLMPGDSIVVREATGTVNVTGNVYNPGLIEFQTGKSFSHYIDSAGGVTPKGNRKDIIVVYANGLIKPNKFLNSPKIKDGCTIVVNEKEEKAEFNIADFATSTLSIISTTLTVLVLSQQASAN